MSRYWSKFCYLKGGWVTLNENFRGKGASSINDFWQQRSRVPGPSYGEKIAEKFNRLSRVHQRHRRQTTDRRQTDGIATAISERNVVTFANKTRREMYAGRVLVRLVEYAQCALLRLEKSGTD